ncbi:MAG: DUF3617 domain-containing protein [Xanthobacteraceae bacterium]|nr:DUF3617 domain-containing protein [Xanthobacteraceae bacterium]
MIRFVHIAGLSSLVAAISPAALADVDMPNRKPGLWEIQIVGSQMGSPTIQQCTDETTDKEMRTSFGPVGKNMCDKQDIQKTATGFTIDATCNIAGTASTSHTEISGDFNSAYTIKVSSNRPGGPAGASSEHTMVMNATWKGSCAAGQKAGDIIMPGGIKMNIKDMQKLRAMMPQ